MRTNTNISEVQSRSSRRRTRTLRNTFNYDTNNELSEIYSNYCEATPRAEHNQYIKTVEDEEQKLHPFKQYQEIIQETNTKQGNSIKEITAAKDQLISKLQKNNTKITEQVQIIWEKIQSIQQVKQTSKKRRKLVEKQTNYQKLQRQLVNAYKSIKVREKQIEMYRKKQIRSGQFIDKLKILKQDLKERQTIQNRLKNQIASKSKQIKQAERLANQMAQKSEVNQLKILSQELEHLIEVTKQTQKRQQQRVSILKKQYICVKKLQRQLIQRGMSQYELQHIKKQCIRQFPTKRQIQERKKDYQAKIQPFSHIQKKEKQKVQQRTRKNLDLMINQLNLLQRKQLQFEKEYQTAKTSRNHYTEMNKSVEQKIRNCQLEYEQLENLNQKLRSKHIQKHRLAKIKSLKQTNTSPLRKSLLLKQKKQFSKQKSMRFKSLPTILNSQNKLTIKKRNCSSGQGSQGSNKFNDKYILGQENRSKKIIGITIYFEPFKSWISGINITYQQSIKGGDYVWRVLDSDLEYKSQSYQCGQSLVKDIIPNFIIQAEKSRLIGMNIILQNGNKKQLGKCSNQQSKLSQKQYISCISGSMSITDLNQKKVSVIQELGFQIYQ